MSNADILDKAIQQAIASGWTGGKHFNWSGDWIGEVPKLWVTSPFPSWPRLLFKTGGVNVETYSYPPELMLFDHDFAKALWPGNSTSYLMHYKTAVSSKLDDEHSVLVSPSEYHLQQMVIADDPIKYLGDNIS